MNEQIKKLAGQALDASVPQTWTTLTAYDLNKFTKKFAELIVQDCMDIAENWNDQLVSAKLVKESNAVGIVRYRIARKFGVKE